MAAPAAAEPGVSELLALLESPQASTRQQAALSIGRLVTADLAPELASRLWADPDFYVRETLTWALVRVREAAIPQVLPKLHAADVGVRAVAVHAVGKLGAHQAADTLVELLGDPDEAVRAESRWALFQFRDPRLIPVLLPRLGVANHHDRALLDQMLAGFDALSVQPLADVVRNAAPEPARHAIEILASIGSPAADAAIPSLRQVIEQSSAAVDNASIEMATAALMTLDQLDSSEVDDAIADAARSSVPRVAAVAKHLIART